jgi:predicted MFS family arabinose efflux permease
MNQPRGFRDRRARVEFAILALGTFFCFTTVSQTALLAVVMQNEGMTLPRIGIVLSAYGAAVVVFMLVAAPVAGRLGDLATLRIGIVLLAAGHLSYQLTIASFPAALLSRCLQGIGYGLFMPTAMTFAKSKLTAERFVYLFGIYASMVPLPNAVGPPLAEAYLDAFGEHLFFIVGAVPAVVAGVLSLLLSDDRPQTKEPTALPLLQTAALSGLRQPLIAIMVVGALYGLIASYMAPLLTDKAIPIGFFFTTFTVVLFASRFVLIGYLESWSKRRVLAVGMAAMAVAYAIIAEAMGRFTVGAAGVLFGLGYSVAYPVLSVWVAEQFEPRQRTTPIALFNTMFSAGILLTPWFGTYVISFLGYRGLLYVLAASGLLLTASLAFTPQARQISGAGAEPHSVGR